MLPVFAKERTASPEEKTTTARPSSTSARQRVSEREQYTCIVYTYGEKQESWDRQACSDITLTMWKIGKRY